MEKVPEIKNEDIPQMAEWAMKEGNPNDQVPVIWGIRQFESCYRLLKK